MAMKFKTFRNILIGGVLVSVAGIGACTVVSFYFISSRPAPSAPPPPVAPATPPAPPIGLAPAAPTSPAPPAIPLAPGARRMDQLIIEQLSQPVSGDKIKDAFNREPFKVNFYRDGNDPYWSRLKIDYNRNEKWDEKWDLEQGQPVKRHVASQDDEQYDQEYRWVGGKWELKTK
ncbi:MAG TPA: hypothetical protein PLB32_17510 [Acidobacteriota bacterium]|nr:hypothetical protein [Acidobacteriota bacterium]